MGVQKDLFVSKCTILKELLKQRADVRSCTESFYSVRGTAALKKSYGWITCTTYMGNEIIQEFHVQCLEARDQKFFVGDLQAWITLARNALWRRGSDHFEA